MTATNYFENRLGAERYAAARPYIHGTALSKFLAFVPLDIPVQHALDVGCGTGQSTTALAAIANRVVGIDASDEMLAACSPHPNIEYWRSTAENIRAENKSFDLITVGQAFHWFDQSAFLAEAHRVLKDAQWLVIYTSWFTAEMKGNTDFATWFKGPYLTRYPSPPRNYAPITGMMANERGFLLRGEDGFSDEIGMTAGRFTDYQLSTTNVLAVAKDQAHLFEDAERWIADSIQPFFDAKAERTFMFSGKIWYLQRDAA